MLECFFVYPVRGIEQGSAPQRTKNSPVDCFFSPREIPACVIRNTPACAGVFFRVSRARNRTRRCAGAFLRDNGTLCFWLYPRHENTPRAFRVFSLSTLGQHRIIPALRLKHRSGICRTSLAVSALRIMRYCPRGSISKKHRASYFLFCLPVGGVALGQGDGAYDGNAKGQGNGNF